MPLKTISLREIDLYYQRTVCPAFYAVLEKANIIKKILRTLIEKLILFFKLILMCA